MIGDARGSAADALRAAAAQGDHQVVAAADGDAALALLEAEGADVLLLRWRARHAEGRTLCRRMRAVPNGRDLFVLAVVGGVADAAAALDAGADDYLVAAAAAAHLPARLTIAERRLAADRARRAVEAELARARPLVAIGETTLTLEHEINNPLAALLGHASLLAMGADSAEQQREYLGIILEQGRRIAAVVRRLGALKDPRAAEYLAPLRGGEPEPAAAPERKRR